MQISIIGQGYVGLSLAMSAINVGYKVIGFDLNSELVEQLKVGETEVPGILSKSIIESISSGLYIPTIDPNDINGSEIIVIAVPTPLDNERQPDLSFVKSAAEVISQVVVGKALVINESTSYPGTLREIIKVICDKSVNAVFNYASAPERIDPGNTHWTIENTPRVVAGITKEASDLAIDFYKSFCSSVYHAESVEIAEASKLFENTFRQINIALVNEFSTICHTLGFSAHSAIKAAATKPFGFMPFYPSIGVGGHCIPVDPTFLSFKAKEVGVSADFIDLANSTNFQMPKKVALNIKNYFNGSLEGKKIQVAGIAYKKGVSDMRESPAIKLIIELESLGAKVSWHDPVVQRFNGKYSVPLDPDSDIGLIITPHQQIDFSIWHNAGTKVLDLSADSKNYGWSKFF